MNSRIYKITIAVLLTIALAGFGTLALAQQGQGTGKGPRGEKGPGQWGRGGYGAGFWSQLTEEQRTQLKELKDKFWAGTKEMHQNARQKRLELQSELAKQSPSAEKAQQLQKELSDISAQLAQARINFVLEAKKISPEADRFFYGKGHRFGGPGKGPGKGPKGYGHGGCGGYGKPNGPGPDCPYL